MGNVPHPIEDRALSRLSSIGVVSPEQLLLHLPKSFDDYTVITTVVEMPFMDSDTVTVMVTVDSTPDMKSYSPPRLSFYVKDSTDQRVRLTAFGAVFEWKPLKIGDSICVRAKVKQWDGELQLEQPELVGLHKVGRLWPNYRGKKGVLAAETVSKTIDEHLDELIEPACTYIRRHFDGMADQDILTGAKITAFKTLSDVFYAIHRPASIEEGGEAVIAATRIAAFEALYNARKRQNRRPDPSSIVRIKSSHVDSLVERLPFPLTSDQKNAVNDLVADMAKPYPMYRLISGDVGTGKTEPLLIAMAAARASGAKVAMLVPNMLLAGQAVNRAKSYWPKIPVCMVAGKAKLDLTDDPIVIGTTAMFNALKKKKWVPNLMVVDEQAKFSRAQREHLAEDHTNLVEATATCIPRSAALILNGGMDMTTISECPVKKTIHSKVMTIEHRAEVLASLKSIMDKGGQVAILYPNVSGGKHADGKSKQRGNLDAATLMWEKLFPGKVAMLHGGMTDDEKLDVIDRMQKKEFSILCASTIIEIGLTLPSLMGLLVVEADRFGVSQLHQVRGRVARHGGEGFFFMYTPYEISDETRERLELVAKITDGFKLAELDMELRGFGDLSEDSSSQHGINRSQLFTGVKIKPSDIRYLSS